MILCIRSKWCLPIFWDYSHCSVVAGELMMHARTSRDSNLMQGNNWSARDIAFGAFLATNGAALRGFQVQIEHLNFQILCIIVPKNHNSPRTQEESSFLLNIYSPSCIWYFPNNQACRVLAYFVIPGYRNGPWRIKFCSWAISYFPFKKLK